MPRKRNVHKNNAARRFAGAKAQSAMEYLMTYGWAILIIAVVLGALFQLGVFNASNFAPKVPPGSCQVFRPNGSGTTSFINLEGVCSGELPQYVAQFSGSSAQIIVNHEYFQDNSFTILAWGYWPPGTNLASPGTPNGDLGYAWSGPSVGDEGFGIFSRSDHWYLNFYGDDLECSAGPVAGRWYQFGASWNASTKLQTIWVNGAANCTRTSSGNLITNSPLYIGSGVGTWDGAYMDGSISNIQIYNASLSASQIQQLYQEGIGGAPIDLQNLVGWWPLNGNANDYSGNGNNGQINGGVTFVSNWWSGYTPP